MPHLFLGCLIYASVLTTSLHLGGDGHPATFLGGDGPLFTYLGGDGLDLHLYTVAACVGQANVYQACR